MLNNISPRNSGQAAEKEMKSDLLQKEPPVPAKEPEEKEESWGELFRFALIVALIVLPIRFFIAQPFLVSGASMDPTFKNGQYLIVDEISYRFEKPKRGEVIIFKRPTENKYLIKRIIGLPDETLEIKGNKITVKNSDHQDGFVLDEPYLKNSGNTINETVTLDSGEYFVMGDNRPVSYDSRSWGPLQKEEIVGRPFVRLYPFNIVNFFPGDWSQTVGQK